MLSRRHQVEEDLLVGVLGERLVKGLDEAQVDDDRVGRQAAAEAQSR
jgi:hypothetical protein